VQEDWDEDFGVVQPGVRYCLLKLVDGRRFLLFRLSHASYDSTSLRVLDSQFTSMAREEAVPNPAEFRSFITYTESLNRNEILDFWEKTLGGCTFVYPPIGWETLFSTPSVSSRWTIVWTRTHLNVVSPFQSSIRPPSLFYYPNSAEPPMSATTFSLQGGIFL
jgi:hypothetical protein